MPTRRRTGRQGQMLPEAPTQPTLRLG